MSSGIKAQIQVKNPSCPIANISQKHGIKCKSIKWNKNKEQKVTEEFISNEKIEEEENIKEIFDYESHTVYRIQRESLQCICPLIENWVCFYLI